MDRCMNCGQGESAHPAIISATSGTLNVCPVFKRSASLTTDPGDPRLTHGVDPKPVEQAQVYLVLSEEERARGFVRPVRRGYVHVGPPGPQFPVRDLTSDETVRWPDYLKFEDYPRGHRGSASGRFWTQAQLAQVGKGCKSLTTMGQALAETWARDPKFYGATYCCHCSKHLAVEEFVWDGTTERLGS